MKTKQNSKKASIKILDPKCFDLLSRQSVICASTRLLKDVIMFMSTRGWDLICRAQTMMDASHDQYTARRHWYDTAYTFTTCVLFILHAAIINICRRSLLQACVCACAKLAAHAVCHKCTIIRLHTCIRMPSCILFFVCSILLATNQKILCSKNMGACHFFVLSVPRVYRPKQKHFLSSLTREVQKIASPSEPEPVAFDAHVSTCLPSSKSGVMHVQDVISNLSAACEKIRMTESDLTFYHCLLAGFVWQRGCKCFAIVCESLKCMHVVLVL